MNNGHHYSADQHAWLKNNRPLFAMDQLQQRFNAQFGTSISKTALHGFCVRHGYTSNKTGRFEKGQTPWNQGKKNTMAANATSFKPGNVPPNWREPGTEVMHGDGYIYLKTESGLVIKHRYIYEQHYGTLPKNWVVVFLDGDTTNCDINNLAAVNRSELVQLNGHENFSSQPAHIKRALIATVRLEQSAKRARI